MGFLAGLFKSRVVTYEAFDGAIRVAEAPGSADWKIDEFEHDGARVLQFERRRQVTLRAELRTSGDADGETVSESGGLRIRERRTRDGRFVFVVSATGSPKAFEQRAEDIERWFSSVSFEPSETRL